MSYKKGDRIGTFSVCIDEAKTPERYSGVVCRCDCGYKKVLKEWEINTHSGCEYCSLERDAEVVDMVKHPAYGVYKYMMDACYDKGSEYYTGLGCVGIVVCEEWKGKFSNFILDMGCKKSDEFLYRYDKKKGFFKENCYWGLSKQYL